MKIRKEKGTCVMEGEGGKGRRYINIAISKASVESLRDGHIGGGDVRKETTNMSTLNFCDKVVCRRPLVSTLSSGGNSCFTSSLSEVCMQ